MARRLWSLAFLPLLWLALSAPAGAQELSPELAARVRELAEAALTRRLAEPNQPGISIVKAGPTPAPGGPNKVVYIGATLLPSKEGQPLLGQAQFYSYADAIQYQVVIDVEANNVVEVTGVQPGHPRLASEEAETARDLVRGSAEGARILTEFPDAQIDFTVTSVAAADHALYGHRIVHVLFHERRQYLSTEPLYVDLTTMEVITGAAIEGR